MRKKAYKWLSLLLTASMLASGVPAYAAGTEVVAEEAAEDDVVITEEADGVTINEGDYQLTIIDEGAKTAAITGYEARGNGTDLTIPETLGGYAVTEIGNAAFYNKEFSGITIPATITKIGYNAFKNCNLVQNVRFENGTGSITVGEAAFAECKDLRSITLSDRITELPAKFAYACGNLETVTWPAKLEKIGNEAFYTDARLKTSDLSGTSLSVIGDYAFKSCKALPVVKLPTAKSLQIGQDAFNGCDMYNGTANGALTIPANVSQIGISAFRNCSGLGSVTFADGNDSITLQKDIFTECERLAGITLSDRVEAIPDSFAYNCKNLKSVSWPAKLSSIGNYAFGKDAKLESADLSSATALTGIGDFAFDNCSALPAVILPTEKSLKIGQNAFSSCSMSGTLVIPKNVTNIESNAFRKSGQAEVVFEAGTGSILMENSVFQECASLKKITLSSRTTELPGSFASYCENLENVIWTAELSSIGDSAFAHDPKLKSSDLSSVSALREIKKEAFYGCSELPLVVFPAENTLVIGSKAFMYCNMSDGEDTGELFIPVNVSELGGSAFQSCTGLGSVRFQEGDSIIKLENAVFDDCERLTRIFFSNRVNELPDYFAYGCNKLVWLDGGTAVEAIGKDAFLPQGNVECEIVLTNANMTFLNYDWFESKRVLVDAAVSVVLKDSYTVEAGKSLDLKPQYTIVPENAKLPELFWDSSDDNIVRSNSKGVVKGVKEGSAYITVSTVQGIVKARVLINVVAKGSGPAPEPEVFVPVPGGGGATDPQPLITESTTKLTLVKGQKFILGNKDWKSGDNKTLKVSKNTLTAKKAGNVTLSRNGQEITAEIVAPAFDKKNLTLTAGETEQLTLCGAVAAGEMIRLSETAEYLPIVFISSAPDVADVDDEGNVYTKSKGKAVITAWINGVAFKCTVKVVDVQKPSFDYTQTAAPLELKPNQSVTVKAKGFSTKTANWSSSRGATAEDGWAKGALYEDGVIRIGKGGKLTAIGAGDTQVTVVSGDVTLNFRVKVSSPVEKSLHLSLGGGSKAVKLYGEKGTIEWAPVEDDQDIVTFERGKIKATKCGETQLYAVRGNFTYILNVYVEDPVIVTPVFEAKGNKYSCELNVGESTEIAFKENLYQRVVFKSNKSHIVYVTPEGHITARGKGTAKLTAKVNGKSITITVKVNQ
ncbi:MAG: leucine-rich repeat protein [Lachnospiraceae bacterium]|nr:leucine-rich repeat protein [Lachnospiraceae bacterium]